MHFSLRESMIPGDGIAAKLAWLQAAGVAAIELDGPSLTLAPAELGAIIGDTPIAVASIDGGPGTLNPDPAKRNAVKDQIRARLDLAAMLGARGVLLVPQFGRTPALPDLSPLRAAADLERDLFIAQLQDLLPASQAAGIPLYIEPLNRYEAYLVNRIEQGLAIAAAAGEGIGVMADFFHMNIEEADIAASITAAAGKIVHVHVADSNRQQPGRGHLDFRPGLAALRATNYDGYYGFECAIVGEPVAGITASMEYLREANV